MGPDPTQVPTATTASKYPAASTQGAPARSSACSEWWPPGCALSRIHKQSHVQVGGATARQVGLLGDGFRRALWGSVGESHLGGASSDQMATRGCSLIVSACQAVFAPLSSRHADLIVNSDLIKDSLYIKNVDVSVNTSFSCSCSCDAPCMNHVHLHLHVPCPCPVSMFHPCSMSMSMFHVVLLPFDYATRQAPRKACWPLPVYHPYQAASRDSCLVEEGCLNGPGMRKVHLAVHLAKYRQHAHARECMVYIGVGVCMVCAWCSCTSRAPGA